MDKIFHIADDDAQLFRRSVGHVKPVRHNQAEMGKPRPDPIPVQRLLDEREVLREMASGHFDNAEIETGEEL
ncbi:MAG: Smr/MutS family protein, partial [Chromatiales bacterium]